MKKGAFLLLILFIFFNQIYSLEITEIMHNPQFYSYCHYDLEWIELYNGSQNNVDSFELYVDKEWVTINKNIEANGYLIIACDLFDDSEDNDSFEEVYGDGSGVWGDSSEEKKYDVYEEFMYLNNHGEVLKIRYDDIIKTYDYSNYKNTLDDISCLTVNRLNKKNYYKKSTDQNYGGPGKQKYMGNLKFNPSNVNKIIKIFNDNNNELIYEENSSSDNVNVFNLSNGKTYKIEVESFGYEKYEKVITINKNKIININLDEKEKIEVELIFLDEDDNKINQVKLKNQLNDEYKIFNSNQKIKLYEGSYSFKIKKEGYFYKKKNITINSAVETISFNLISIDSLKINEVDFHSQSTEVEWIELRNTTKYPINIKGIRICDKKNELIINKDIIVDDYVILTENKQEFESVYFQDNRVFNVDSMFTLNDSSDVFKIYLDNILIDKAKFNEDIYNSNFSSLERINLNKKFEKSNSYPAFKKTPLKSNSVKGLISDEVEVKLTEVYPFSRDEYVELYVEKTVNENGTVLSNFNLTDMDSSYTFDRKLYKKGDIIVLDKLSLSDDGDQVVLKRNGKIVDKFCYKEKYSELSENEINDLKELDEDIFSIFTYKDKDTTLSFNRNKYNNWEYTFFTKGALAYNVKDEDYAINVKKQIKQGEDISISYKTTNKLKITTEIYDVGGIKRKTKESDIAGEGSISIKSENLEMGRYIYHLKIERGGNSDSKKGTFIIY